MSFSLLGPFSFGAKVTSAVFNQLDTDHSNSLDKSTAGDSLAGVITFVSGGKINFNQANSCAFPTANAGSITGLGAINITGPEGIVSNSDAGITAITSGGVKATVANGITTSHAGGIAPGLPGGITDGGYASGIAATIAGGISDGGIAQGIEATIAGGISATISQGIRSDAAGGIAMNGGSGDYLQYLQTRSITTFMAPLSPINGSGWSYTVGSFPFLTGPGTAAAQYIPLTKFYNALVNGAVLASVTLYFNVGFTHASVPAVLPSFNVLWVNLGGVGSPPPAAVSLASGGAVVFPTPASGAAWYASGNLQTLTFTCNQHNSLGGPGLYAIQLNDESGANSSSGNQFWGFNLSFNSISNNGPVL